MKNSQLPQLSTPARQAIARSATDQEQLAGMRKAQTRREYIKTLTAIAEAQESIAAFEELIANHSRCRTRIEEEAIAEIVFTARPGEAKTLADAADRECGEQEESRLCATGNRFAQMRAKLANE